MNTTRTKSHHHQPSPQERALKAKLWKFVAMVLGMALLFVYSGAGGEQYAGFMDLKSAQTAAKNLPTGSSSIYDAFQYDEYISSSEEEDDDDDSSVDDYFENDDDDDDDDYNDYSPSSKGSEDEDDDDNSSVEMETTKTTSSLPQPDEYTGDYNPDETRKVIQFTVAGWPKTGTTFLLKQIFGSAKEHVYMGDEEIRQLNHGNVGGFLRNFEGVYNSTSTQKLGFKCPGTILKRTPLRALSNYFPDTKLIVSLRHPINWFQSFYNFRLLQYDMPPPSDLVGPCGEFCRNKDKDECVDNQAHLCTGLAQFHWYLSWLGYTELTSPEELQLLHHPENALSTKGIDFSNTQVFVTELNQLNLQEPVAMNTLLHDLETFLDLPDESLPRLDIENPPTEPKTGSNKQRERLQQDDKKDFVLKICDEQHTELRQHLLQIGREASQWLEDYFLKSPNVVVSQRDAFLQHLQSWKQDPCDNKARRKL